MNGLDSPCDESCLISPISFFYNHLMYLYVFSPKVLHHYVGQSEDCDKFHNNSVHLSNTYPLQLIHKCRFAHYGVGIALGGGGDKHFKFANLLKKCGYDVCILMDSDIAEEEDKKQAIEEIGVRVFSWDTGNAVEEQVFSDATLECAERIIALAIENKGFDSIKSQLIRNIEKAESMFTFSDKTISFSPELDESVLLKVGKVSKDGGWFKRIDFGQALGEIVFQPGQLKENCGFNKTMISLEEWVRADAP